ncbi:MAG: septum formation initiator family protein [Brachymonas sp.]|jgi:cell division protein FtsB|nr:septum formation initiator family protein [Brachymonas sp.]MBP9651397.1 septum formation initiator family protein [Brachymonas sp.]
MSTRPIVPLILAALLGLLQVQIWTGRGSVRQVAEQQQRLAELRASNQQAEADIARLRSEISDLREGLHTVEEKARYELGMVKPNEIFVQIAH